MVAYGPQQPFPPQPQHGPRPPRKGMHPGLLSALIAAPIILIVLFVIGTVAGQPEKAPVAARTSVAPSSPAAPPAPSSPAPVAPAVPAPVTSAPAPVAPSPRPSVAPTVPTPTAAQQRAYLAALARIDPGLTVNTERVMRRAGRVCERIIRPPGGNLTLQQYTVLELSGGNATIDEAQAREVIKAVQVWCHQ